MSTTTHQAVRLAVIETLLIIGLAELAVMLLIGHKAFTLHPAVEALLDVVLLCAITAPLLVWRIRAHFRHAARAEFHDHNPAVSTHLSGVCAAIFVVGSGVSLGLAWNTWEAAQADGQRRFEERVKQLEINLRNPFEKVEQALQSLVGIYASDGSFSRQSFRSYWAARGYNRDFPGIRGFGYIERVPFEQLTSYTELQKQIHSSDFQVNTKSSGSELQVITLIEPIETNGPAIGLDIASEAIRLAAAKQAVRSGRATLTGTIALVQDEHRRPGFLLLVPLYEGGQIPATEEQRALLHRGFVYSPIVAEEAFGSLAALSKRDIAFDVYAQTEAGDELLVFPAAPTSTTHSPTQKDTPVATTAAGGLFKRDVSLNIADRTFGLRASSTAEFDASALHDRAAMIGVGGILLSALLALAFWLLTSARARAEARAVELTGELQRLAAIARRTHDTVIITDVSGKITWANDAFTRTTGFTLEEVLGLKPGDLLQCDQTNPATVALISEHLARRDSCRVEILNRHKSGHLYWVDLEIQPLYDGNQKINGFMAVERDITQQRETQDRERAHAQQLAAALRETQALMNTINEHAIVSEAGPDGRILRVNEAFCRISGYEADELLGQDHRIVNSGVQDRSFWNDMWRTITSGQPWRGQVCNRAKDGTLYWVDSIIAPFIDHDGKIEKYVSIRFDVTQAHHNEAELRRERQRLKSTLEGTNVGTWEVNILTGENRIDDRWASILGYTLEELAPISPERWKELTHPQDESVAQVKLREYLKGHAPIYEVERRLRHRDGHWVWVLSRGIAVSSLRNGQVEWMSGTHMDVTERHQLYEEIDRRTRLLTAIIENLPGGLSAFDADLHLILRNHQFGELLDLPEPLLSSPPVTFESIIRYNAENGEYGQGDVEAMVASIVDRARSPSKHHFERTRPNGRVLEIRGAPLPDGGFVTTYIDVTEKRRSERDARLADEILREAINTLDEAFAIYDDHDRLLMCNERYRVTYPVSAELMKTGTSFEEIIRYSAERGEFSEAIGRVDDWVKERLDARKQEKTDLIQELSTGRFLRVVERRTEKGYTVGFRIDVTDLIKSKNAAEAATRASETALARLQAIYDILPVGLTLTDREGNIIDCNPASERLLGISKAEHLARRYDSEQWVILREDGRSMPTQEFPSVIALSERRTVQDSVMQVVTPTHSVWLSVSAMPVDSSELGVVVAYVDITESRNQRQALLEAKQSAEQASQAKSQFLANMSHEIRTPMNAILGMLSLLQATDLSVRQQDYASKTEGAARSLLGLLNDILDFSKVEAGKMTLETAPFRMDQLLRDLSVILSSNTGDKHLEVLFDVDPLLPTVLIGDSLRLKQVLINLAGNAIKFTEQGMVVVRISVRSKEANQVKLEFSIADTGIGIAPENLQRIFDGFSQAEASITRRFGGTGLGLAISSRLVNLMGGQLLVESQLGKGTRFYFNVRLPFTHEPTVLDSLSHESQNLQVLIIDDNPTAQLVLQGMVKPLGWSVDLASSGSEALNKLKARQANGMRPFDAVFVDWQMPGMDGWETSLQIRHLLADAKAPILVMVTAHGREMLAKRPAHEQALLNGFLVKPVTPTMLLEAVVEARQQRTGLPLKQSAPAKLRRLQGMRVLLVEDNKINQQVAQELLEREGARVALAENGELAVHAIAKASTAWDVVLMDIQMPVMDGYTATRKIRQELQVLALPVIAMTANAMENDRREALAAGMNAHVGKPFNLDELVHTMLAHSSYQPPAMVPDSREAENTRHTTASPRTQVTANAPSLPAGNDVLDIAAAAQRLGGDTLLLLSILKSFSDDLQRQPEQLRDLLLSGRGDEASRMLHSLKGSAGTVGAIQLAEVAATAERRLQNAPLPIEPEVQEIVAGLQRSVLSLTEELAPVLQEMQPKPEHKVLANTALDRPRLQADLHQLLGLLQKSDLASLALFSQLHERHKAALQQALVPLDEAMTNLDFDRAAKLCVELQHGYTM